MKYGGILARNLESDEDDLKQQHIDKLDFVICNLYPFKETVSKIGVTMKGYKACILKNHGLVASDETLEKAYHVMMEVENLSRLYITVRNIGDYSVLSDSEMEVILEKFKNYGLNVKHKK